MKNVVIVVLLLLISACGQKGHLYLPESRPSQPILAGETVTATTDASATSEVSTDSSAGNISGRGPTISEQE